MKPEHPGCESRHSGSDRAAADTTFSDKNNISGKNSVWSRSHPLTRGGGVTACFGFTFGEVHQSVRTSPKQSTTASTSLVVARSCDKSPMFSRTEKCKYYCLTDVIRKSIFCGKPSMKKSVYSVRYEPILTRSRWSRSRVASSSL